MKKLVLFLLLAIDTVTMWAQTTTTALTVYKEFQPATIHLADGRLLKVGFANIFLKNSSLLVPTIESTLCWPIRWTRLANSNCIVPNASTSRHGRA